MLQILGSRGLRKKWSSGSRVRTFRISSASINCSAPLLTVTSWLLDEGRKDNVDMNGDGEGGERLSNFTSSPTIKPINLGTRDSHDQEPRRINLSNNMSAYCRLNLQAGGGEETTRITKENFTCRCQSSIRSNRLIYRLYEKQISRLPDLPREIQEFGSLL